MGLINRINAIVVTYLTYQGYILRRNLVELLKEIMVYFILYLAKNKVNIERLQVEEFSLFPFFIFALTFLSHVNGILQLITVVLLTVV